MHQVVEKTSPMCDLIPKPVASINLAVLNCPTLLAPRLVGTRNLNSTLLTSFEVESGIRRGYTLSASSWLQEAGSFKDVWRYGQLDSTTITGRSLNPKNDRG